MNHRLFGSNINVALVFGLLQFVTTFALAWLYSRFSTARLDPLARELDHAVRRDGEGGLTWVITSFSPARCSWAWSH